MPLLIAALMSLLAEPSAAGANWVRVSGNDKVVENVDSQSIRRAGDEVHFNREMRFTPARPEGFDRMAFSSIASCKDRTVFDVKMSFHLGDHELMSSTFRKPKAGKGKGAGEPAAPGSPLARALAYACEGVVEK